MLARFMTALLLSTFVSACASPDDGEKPWFKHEKRLGKGIYRSGRYIHLHPFRHAAPPTREPSKMHTHDGTH